MNRIAESELIINERGAIYHLDLKPDELANKIFLVGDPGRVPVVSKYFDRIEFCVVYRKGNTPQSGVVQGLLNEMQNFG